MTSVFYETAIHHVQNILISNLFIPSVYIPSLPMRKCQRACRAKIRDEVCQHHNHEWQTCQSDLIHWVRSFDPTRPLGLRKVGPCGTDVEHTEHTKDETCADLKGVNNDVTWPFKPVPQHRPDRAQEEYRTLFISFTHAQLLLCISTDSRTYRGGIEPRHSREELIEGLVDDVFGQAGGGRQLEVHFKHIAGLGSVDSVQGIVQVSDVFVQL